ncbi:MAG: MCE family protein [Ignavibacteria bacterium]|nr:MCE family protein [Ignavibacteria bacterium]
MRRKFNEIKVGIFVLIAAGIVLGTIFWAKGCFLNRNNRDMVAYFGSTGGLQLGEPVTINGVVKGKVHSIELEGDSIRIEFSLDESVKIKKDYKMEITAMELMSGKQIFINPGKSKEEINYELPLIGGKTMDMTEIFRNITDLSKDVKDLIFKFDKSTDTLDMVLTNINDLIGDPVFKSNFKTTFANLEKTTRNLNAFISENRISLKQITANVDRTVTDFDDAVKENNPEIKKTLVEMQNLTLKVDSLIGGIGIIVNDIHEQKSGLGKFIYDEKFFKQINTSLEEIEKLTKKIREDGIRIKLF